MRILKKGLLYIFLTALVFVTLLPVMYAFFGSFKTNQELLVSGARLLPESFTLDNYIKAWKLADFKTYTFNSLYLTFFSVIGVVSSSAMAGYAFSRGTFPGKNIIFTLFVSTMFICLGTITLYPKLQIARLLHINKSLWGIIIMNVFSVGATNLFLVRSFINSLPREIDEAATIDGCSFGRIFASIILPLLKPILATIAIISFKTVWNDYLLPMVFTISTPSKAPLVVGVVSLKNSGDAATSWNLMLAGTMISIIPMMVLYLCLNRYFVEGMTNGAVKG